MMSNGVTLRDRYGDFVADLCDDLDLTIDASDAVTSSEKRRSPVKDADRRLFDEIVLSREEEQRIDAMSKEELVALFKGREGKKRKERRRGHLERLLKMDCFIGLKYTLEAHDWDLSSGHLRVGSFGLVYPSLKALNDVYLGQIGADRFIDKLQKEINSELQGSVHSLNNSPYSNIFYMNHKGGYFLLDLKRFSEAHDIPETTDLEAAENILKTKLKSIQWTATELLKEEIEVRIRELIGEENDKRRRLHFFASQDTGLDFVEVQEKDSIDRDLVAIEEKINALSELHKSLSGGYVEEGVSMSFDAVTMDAQEVVEDAVPGYFAHISFGIADLDVGRDPEAPDNLSLYSSVVNSQRALNSGALRTFNISAVDNVETSYMGMPTLEETTGNFPSITDEMIDEQEEEEEGLGSVRERSKSMRSVLQKFDYVYLLSDLVRARDDMYGTVVEEVDGDVNIKSEWTPFFVFDEHGEVRMRPEMIRQFRKQRISKKYTGPLVEKSLRRSFARYYDRVNTIDALKNFRMSKAAHYMSRVQRILGLVQSVEAALAQPDVSEEVLRKLAKETTFELGVLVKDEAVEKGKEVARTVRGALAPLFDEGDKVIVSADHIGFGGFNQTDHERIVISLINMLGVERRELDYIAGREDKEVQSRLWKKLITDKFAHISGNAPVYDRFLRLLLSVGDAGTKRIRDAENKLHALFVDLGAQVSLMVGGDEVTAFVSGLPEGLVGTDAIGAALAEIATECRLRMFGVVQSADHSPKDDKAMVARFIRTGWAADSAHTQMKEEGDQVPVRVVTMRQVLETT